MDKETKREIIKGLQDKQKIVINKCYGGFGLSMKAIHRYAELTGTKVYFYEQTKYKFKEGEDEYERIDDLNKKSFISHSIKKDLGKTIYKLPDKDYFSTYDMKRDDEILVQVVKELGKKANGEHAELEIVEIPSGVEWEISDYDGMETIHEKHRSWG